MTLTPIGFTGTVDQSQWARLQWAAGQVDSFEGVSSGFTPSPGGAVRAVSLAGPAVAYACGVRVDMDTTSTITHDTVTTGSRLDYGCLVFAWTGTTINGQAFSAGVSLSAVRGSASALPTLTRNPGVLWMLPLYTITVTPTTGVPTASAIVDARPGVTTTATVTIPGNFAVSTPPMLLTKVGQTVELSGAFQRTSTVIARGGSAINTVLIPSGYRPPHETYAGLVAGVTSTTAAYHTLVVKADGTVVLYPGTADIGINDTLRVLNTTWLTTGGS